MSNFSQLTKHPETGKIEEADWLDDHFGRHRYGIRFADGQVFTPSQITWSEMAAKNARIDELAALFRKTTDAIERQEIISVISEAEENQRSLQAMKKQNRKTI